MTLGQLRWAKDQKTSGVFAPVYLERIMVVCPTCNKGGMWAVPEGFKIAIAGRLLVTCENGHQWGIYRAWEESHDD